MSNEAGSDRFAKIKEIAEAARLKKEVAAQAAETAKIEKENAIQLERRQIEEQFLGKEADLETLTGQITEARGLLSEDFDPETTASIQLEIDGMLGEAESIRVAMAELQTRKEVLDSGQSRSEESKDDDEKSPEEATNLEVARYKELEDSQVGAPPFLNERTVSNMNTRKGAVLEYSNDSSRLNNQRDRTLDELLDMLNTLEEVQSGQRTMEAGELEALKRQAEALNNKRIKEFATASYFRERVQFIDEARAGFISGNEVIQTTKDGMLAKTNVDIDDTLKKDTAVTEYVRQQFVDLMQKAERVDTLYASLTHTAS
ncbi:MAG TPA: hypothetical protein DCY48_01130 [Candidatus Magasanikbacteria bacterium]|nr:MAG: hypothetical protein A3I74_03600 [Candidatus Magasanikbacteria bacterium RIFCSPLOWO2_02_FULL_47_16]OGH80167.1 MAG: hypothetical protein A3C10_03185 [Candidatus Magasanikbacteria bacterium RIFCSPHIGHO2_02_FULL_48_18]HAZ28361.1 hypothetical protein [Candidatus Magasanikbacteria bacterium]